MPTAQEILMQLPEWERPVIQGVAEEYKLTPHQTALLATIRKIEQGPVGLEFGVMNKEARRFKNDPNIQRSLATQAKWAAGTIRDRYTGDLDKFAQRWAPIGAENDPTNLNKNWVKNARFYLGERQ